MKPRGLFSILLIVVGMNTALAQSAVEADLTLDFASSYVWRGSYLGGAALQPELTVGWKGLELSVWGSTGLTDQRNEIDLTLSYTIGGLNLSVIDYWDNSGEIPYFYYKPRETGHSFEAAIAYDFGPVEVSWQTFFAGSDYQEDDGRRAFSSYFELSAPFQLASMEWEAKVGVVPWASDYYETQRFTLQQVSLKATKDIPVSEKFVLPLYGELIANPSNRKLFFVAGFTINVGI